MKTTAVSEGIINWERMKALVAEARSTDPSLARRSARFSAAPIVVKMPRLVSSLNTPNHAPRKTTPAQRARLLRDISM